MPYPVSLQGLQNPAHGCKQRRAADMVLLWTAAHFLLLALVGLSGPVVKYIVAIDVARIRFLPDVQYVLERSYCGAGEQQAIQYCMEAGTLVGPLLARKKPNRAG